MQKKAVALLKENQGNQNGLSKIEVKRRQEQFGFNEVKTTNRSLWSMLKKHVWGPIPGLIETALILSFAVGDKQNFSIIAVLFLVNIVIGLGQELRANRSINLLQKAVVHSVSVFRDGAWTVVPVRELVVGDIIKVRLGDIVAADCVLLEGTSLSVDQSTLTGESLPVEKNQGDIIFGGTVVTVGEAQAVVSAIGSDSQFGQTTKLVNAKIPQSNFERSITAISRNLIVMAFILVGVILVVGIVRQESMSDILTFALVLIVAAIPVALPTVLSATMAIGSLALAKQKAIVRTVTAVEELAGMTILCTDKTGTLTENHLSITDVRTFSRWNKNTFLALAGTAVKPENSEAVQKVIWETLRKNDSAFKIFADYQIVDYQPFNPADKFSRSKVKIAGVNHVVFLGAVPAVMNQLNLTSKKSQEVTAVVDTYAKEGKRAMLVAAISQTEQKTQLAVLVLSDTLRSDTITTLKSLKTLGLHIIMITGDHIAVAKHVAKQIGLGSKVKAGAKIKSLRAVAKDTAGFAGVLPKDKFALVTLLQKNQAIVGMTGDGVNDAPALRRASAGIAVAGATDAARNAADIIFTSKGLTPLVTAVEVSRQIFARMHAYALYRIAETIRILLFVTLSVVIFKIYPLTATMIVLLAILNDAAILSVAYDRAEVAKSPQQFNVKRLVQGALFFGVVGVISSFTFLYVAYIFFGVSIAVLQTLIYLKLSVAGHLLIFATRTKKWFFQDRPSMILIGAVFVTQCIATVIAVNGIFLTPITFTQAVIVWSYALLSFFVTDFIKVLYYNFRRRFFGQK